VNLFVLSRLQALPSAAVVPPPLAPLSPLPLGLPTDPAGWQRLLADQAAGHAHLLHDLSQSLAFVRKNLVEAQEVSIITKCCDCVELESDLI
jgi:hypothetical protein